MSFSERSGLAPSRPLQRGEMSGPLCNGLRKRHPRPPQTLGAEHPCVLAHRARCAIPPGSRFWSTFGSSSLVRHATSSATWIGLGTFPPFAAVIAWRLLDEERFLAEHLAGYAAYRERVRYRLVPGVWKVRTQRGCRDGGVQYPIRRPIMVAAPENENFALSKLGGPMKPFAWFETTVPSFGIPKSPVSSLPFPFSSWRQATA